MRSKCLYPILCAVIVVLSFTPACSAFNSTPTASNFYMAVDQDGENQTTAFSPTDNFYVFFDVSGIEPGTKFQSRWYGLDLEGQDPNIPVQIIDYVYNERTAKLYFQLSPIANWPVGNYKVEVYMSNAKVGEQTFRVQ